MSYEDVNSSLKNVYLGDYLSQSFGVNGLTDYLILSDSEDVYRFRVFQNDSARFVEVFNQESINLSEPLVTLFNSTDANITSFSVGKAVYALTWDADELNASLQSWSEFNAKYASSLSYTKLSSETAEVSVVELGGETIKINYANDSLSNDLGSSFTGFGSKVSFSNSQANLVLPDERVVANIWYGRKTAGVEAKEGTVNPVGFSWSC